MQCVDCWLVAIRELARESLNAAGLFFTASALAGEAKRIAQVSGGCDLYARGRLALTSLFVGTLVRQPPKIKSLGSRGVRWRGQEQIHPAVIWNVNATCRM